MCNRIDLNKVTTFVIPISLLLGVYKSPFPMMDLGFFLLSVIFCISVLSRKKFVMQKNDRIWMYYLGYIVAVSLIAFFDVGTVSASLIKQVIYILFILYFLGGEIGFDHRKAIDWYKKGALICTIYIFIQSAAYYLFSYGLPGYIPELIYTESYADRISYIATSSFFRPTSLTYEPTHYATYVTVAIILYLFQKRKRSDLICGAFISLGVFLSTSSIGIACVIGIWLFWLFKSFLQRNLNRMIIAVLIGVISIFVMVYFFKGDVGEKILNRTFGSGAGMGGNATVGRFEGYGLLPGMSATRLVFGNGYGILDESVSFYSSWAFNFLCIGIIGTLIVFAIMLHYYVNAPDTATRLILVLLFFKCVVAPEFFTSTILFYFMFVIPVQHKSHIGCPNEYLFNRKLLDNRKDAKIT